MTPRLRWAGGALVLFYATVAMVTHHLAPEGFRPLFDGFAPPQPYKWVNPPPELARDNQPPAEATGDVPVGPDGSEVTNTTTGDAQAIASLETGSVPPNPPDTAVRLKLTPLDPGALGPLPPETKALSNAYLVSLAYQPSQAPVARLAKAGTVALTASARGDRLLYSGDGSSWQDTPSRPYGDGNGRFASLQATGYYLVAGQVAAAGAAPGSTRRSPNTFLLFVVGVVPILGAALVLRPPPPLPAPASGRRSRSGAAKRGAGAARRRRRK